MVAMRRYKLLTVLFSVLCAAVLLKVTFAAPPSKTPPKPAALKISVTPEVAAAGGAATVEVRVEPLAGFVINRYPKIKLEVKAHEGLVAAASASVGNDSPPPPDNMDSNYFDKVDPLRLKLSLDGGAPGGSHEVAGRLTYAYCVKKSGYCSRVRVPIQIPLTVK